MVRCILFLLGTLLAALAVAFISVRRLELRTLFLPYKESGFADVPTDYRDVFFSAADGTRLHGWFVPVEGAEYTLLYAHGNAGNISHRIEKVESFKRRGLSVFIFDYRGYGRSSGRPGEQGLYSDAYGAYDWLTGQGISPARVIGYGESIGGAVIIELARKREMAGLVTECAFSSLKEMANAVVPFIPSFLFATGFNSQEKVREVRVPKLFISSLNDEIVPFKLGKGLYEAAAPPKEFLRLRGGHNTCFFEHEERIMTAINGLIAVIKGGKERKSWAK